MPTYEYKCDSCGNGFETVQKMVDKALEKCPECGKKIRRVLTGGIGISFKGSGFYVTDNINSASPTSAAQAKKGEGSGGSASSTGMGSSSGASASSAVNPASGTVKSTPAASPPPVKSTGSENKK